MFQKKKRKKKKRTDVNLMKELEYYRAKSIKVTSRQKYAIAGILVLLVIGGVLFSPLFAVKNIRNEGAVHFTTSQLCEKIGLSPGDNTIFFGKGRAARLLEKEPYIEKAKVSAKLPDTMIITVTERKVRGYVPYMGSYLYIDDVGRVLDVQDAYYEALPLVKGLSFGNFKKGEVIPAENPEALDVMLQISQVMEKYELLDLVVEIDVSNPDDIYADVNQVQIHLGDMENSEQKIKIMAEIMKKIPEKDRGTLDLSDLNKPIIFQYLM